MTSLEIIFISKYLHFLLEKYKISLKTPQKAAIYVFFFTSSWYKEKLSLVDLKISK